MFAAPPPGWKAGDYKEYLKQNPTQGMVEAQIVDIPEGGGRPKRQKPPPPLPIPPVSGNNNPESGPLPKKTKKDSTNKQKDSDIVKPASNVLELGKIINETQVSNLYLQVINELILSNDFLTFILGCNEQTESFKYCTRI